MANSYDKGSTVKVYTSVAFKTSGAATDPTTVTLLVQDPNGTETSYTYALGQVTKDGTGLYSKSITMSTPGTWYYKFIGTGTCAAVDKGHLIIEDDVFAQ